MQRQEYQVYWALCFDSQLTFNRLNKSSRFLFGNGNVKTEFSAFLSREWHWLLMVAAWGACSKTSKPAYSAQTKAAFISRVRDSQFDTHQPRPWHWGQKARLRLDEPTMMSIGPRKLLGPSHNASAVTCDGLRVSYDGGLTMTFSINLYLI